MKLEDFVSEALRELVKAGETGEVKLDIWVKPNEDGDIIVLSPAPTDASNIKFSVMIDS